jgi:hypothetical protein
MKKHRKPISVMDVNSIPSGYGMRNGKVMPLVNGQLPPKEADYPDLHQPAPPKETFQSFLAEERRKVEEEAAREQATKAASQAENARQMALDVLYKRTSPALVQRCRRMTEQDYEKFTSVEMAQKALADALTKAKRMLLTDSGIELTPVAERRIKSVRSVNLELAWDDPQTYVQLFDYMVELKAFAEGEIVTHIQEPPELELSLDDHLRLSSTLDKKDDARLKYLVLDSMITNEVVPVVAEWEASLYQNFGQHLSDDIRKFLFTPNTGLFAKMNWSLTDKRNYDAARRELCRRGYWNPDVCLTVRETLEQMYQNNDPSLGTTPLERDREYLRRLHEFEHKGVLDAPRKGNI